MNQVDPNITVILDKERHLRLDINAMVAFERVTGKNLLRGLDLDKFSAIDLRTLLWACLKREDKELTEEAVGDMIHAGNMPTVIEKLTEAWEIAMPESSESIGPLVESPQSP